MCSIPTNINGRCELKETSEGLECTASGTYPVNILAHVEYAVTAWSCSLSSAKVCPNAIQAGPNRGSISEVLLEKCMLTTGQHILTSVKLPEVLARLCPFPTAQVPDTYCIPADWVLWFAVDHFMRQNEEF